MLIKSFNSLIGLVLLLTAPILVKAQDQSFIVRDIRSFGAKGDGRTFDHVAFERAAEFFNERKGNGKLVIPNGTYLIGKQIAGNNIKNKPAFEGQHVLHLKNVRNLQISGEQGAVLKYVDSLKYGSFDPITGEPFQADTKRFTKKTFAATIGKCIFIEDSRDVMVSGLEIDGNSGAVILGGKFGDTGRQLPHYGISIKNSRKIIVDNIYVHHSALDGIAVSNAFQDSLFDEVEIRNSKFEYNSRQGLSWIGGNGLKVINCSFNHSGRGAFKSAPGAGVDIEAEVSPIRNGYFENCEFINNNGVGLVADSGDSANCTFVNSTFWGVTTWSIWVDKPSFTFINSNIYGSVVHGYNSPHDSLSTKFIKCNFEDKPFNGKGPHGKFLVESNNKKRVSFEQCTFIAHEKKLIWVKGDKSWDANEKYKFIKCDFIIKGAHYPQREWVAVLRGILYKDCTFDFQHPMAKEKAYYLNSKGEFNNVDLGGNSIIYSAKP